MRWNKPTPGFSLIETIVAATMAATVMTGVFMTIGNVYFTQKKISIRQNLASESRFLMERTLRMIRDNTLDYDRFFVEEGPALADCAEFNVNQMPFGLQSDSGEPTALLAGYGNTRTTRAALGYKNVFMWNTTTSPVSPGLKIPDRTLGGLSLFDLDSDTQINDPDPCAAAFPGGELNALYLINSSRDTRYGLRFNETDGVLELQTQIGVDMDNNGTIDAWGPEDINRDGDFLDQEDGDVLVRWDTDCRIRVWNEFRDMTIEYPVDSGNVSDEAHEYCLRGHDWTPISLSSLAITDFWVTPSPARDPFLAFRSDDDQVHPHVQVHLETELAHPSRYGFDVNPSLSLQTMVSSRVFGDTRQ